jgi:phosphoglycerate kinase
MALNKKSVRHETLTDIRVLARMDFNVPLHNGRVADDTRLEAALPTIRHCLEKRARLVLCSHLGRPKGRWTDGLSLQPVAERLGELLGAEVTLAPDCVGHEAEAAVEALYPGGILLLENLRFHEGEKANTPEFSAALARLGDILVNDAFGTAHRAHASNVGVARTLHAVAGLLMERELAQLSAVRDDPGRPVAVVLGGAKIADKIGAVERFLELADTVLVGGGMANTLLAAKGRDMGESLVDTDGLDAARRILDAAGDRLVLPVDLVTAPADDPGGETRTVPAEGVEQGWSALDVGPETVRRFARKAGGAATAIWNGPLGYFEREPFDRGTVELAKALADSDARVVVGGGDTAAAVVRAGVADRMAHVSTGGGAFLEFMQGKELPGVAALADT